MKLILAILSCLVLTAGNAFAQKKKVKESFYVYDKNWKETSLEAAVFMLRVQQRSDTCFQFDFYNFNGPLIRTEQYKDTEGRILHGAVRYYSEKGFLDSTGIYVNGKKHGDFYKLVTNSDSLKFQTKYVYQEDLLIETRNLLDAAKDSTKYDDEKESEYPGGIGKWSSFLNKNLRYPKRAMDLNKQGRVSVFFEVDAQGKVIDPFIGKSVEYTLDDESVRMIAISGKWIPAFQGGKQVKSYKIQPIGYRLE